MRAATRKCCSGFFATDPTVRPHTPPLFTDPRTQRPRVKVSDLPDGCSNVRQRFQEDESSRWYTWEADDSPMPRLSPETPTSESAVHFAPQDRTEARSPFGSPPQNEHSTEAPQACAPPSRARAAMPLSRTASSDMECVPLEPLRWTETGDLCVEPFPSSDATQPRCSERSSSVAPTSGSPKWRRSSSDIAPRAVDEPPAPQVLLRRDSPSAALWQARHKESPSRRQSTVQEEPHASIPTSSSDRSAAALPPLLRLSSVLAQPTATAESYPLFSQVVSFPSTDVESQPPLQMPTLCPILSADVLSQADAHRVPLCSPLCLLPVLKLSVVDTPPAPSAAKEPTGAELPARRSAPKFTFRNNVIADMSSQQIASLDSSSL